MDTDPRTARDLRRQVRDLTGRWHAEGRCTPRNDSWLRGFDPEFSRELAAQRLIGLTWPAEYGGAGLGNVSRLAVTEELLRAGAPVAAHWIADRQIGPSILRHGTPQLRAEILPGITSGEFTFCLGMSEPEAGSDLASVRTTATAVDGGWVIDGRKTWTSGAHRSSHLYLLARTATGERKHEGLTEFVLDMDSPGITVTPIFDLAGEHHFNEVLLENVFVPAGRLLGELGNGWRQVIEQLSFERGGPERILSTYPLFAQLISAGQSLPQGLHGELGVLVARLTTLRTIAFSVAERMDRGHAPIQEAATLKYLGNAFEQDVAEFARHALGADGVSAAGSYGQAMLASPGFSLRGGAADVLLGIIARQETAGHTTGPAAAGDARPEDGADLRDLIGSIARTHTEPAPGAVPGCWRALAEAQLPVVGVAEELGGVGGSLTDLAVVAGELGRRAISTPLIDTAVANWAAAPDARPCPGIRTIFLTDLPEPADGRTLTGVLPPGRWGASAEDWLVYCGDAAFLVDPRAAGVALERDVDIAGEELATVTLTAVAATPLPNAPDAAEVRLRLGLLWAAAISGAIEGAYELTRGYVATREQFGKPLVRIPAVASGLATVRTSVILSAAALRRACSVFDDPGSGADRRLAAVATARIVAGQGATQAARLTHQLHGAMGITREYPLQRLTRRLWAWRDAGSAERDWSATLAALALRRGEPVVWDELTA